MDNKVICPRCGSASQLITGKTLYPNIGDLADKWFYYCNNNHEPMWVGCMGPTKQPMGTLADAFTRYWRKQAHNAFDRIWKTKRLTRTAAYGKLASELSLDSKQCHIGMFDAKTCKRVVEIATGWLNGN